MLAIDEIVATFIIVLPVPVCISSCEVISLIF
jgi:hypothetical protein